MFILLLCLLFSAVKAQSPSSQKGLTSQAMVTNFQPSPAVVIGILLFILVLFILILLVLAWFFQSRTPVHHNQQIQEGIALAASRVSGIDKAVIESLPFFKFSLLKGSREGLECAVCLSRFEDIEILRLLPKCKHAFHIDCVDQWLENHSSCPLCRHKVSGDDLSLFTYSGSFRYLSDQSGLREDSNLEIFVQREEEYHQRSSRFSFGGSFRKFHKGKKEGLLIHNQKDLHKHKHKITVSEVVLKNRWSSVSSSDLVFLNSEMINATSSGRFSASDPSRVIEDGKISNIKEEMEWKRAFESKFGKIFTASESEANSSQPSKVLNPTDQRSMSEITVKPRFTEFNTKNSPTENPSRNNVRDERMRSLWLPIAQRTVQWFANREKSTSKSHNTIQNLNV